VLRVSVGDFTRLTIKFGFIDFRSAGRNLLYRRDIKRLVYAIVMYLLFMALFTQR